MYLVTIATMVRKKAASCCFECHFKSNVNCKAIHKVIHMHLQQQKTVLIKDDICIMKLFLMVLAKKVLFLCLGKRNYMTHFFAVVVSG